MSIVSKDQVTEIFERVEAWPADAKRELIGMINASLEEDKVPRRPKGSLADLIGLLKTDGLPPSDEEIAEMLHEERMRRYGA